MKHKYSKQIMSMLLAFVMLVGLIPATALTVSAQNITGLMYASTVIADRGVVLMGDTHLYMDIDLSVPYIEGDYNLTIDGSGAGNTQQTCGNLACDFGSGGAAFYLDHGAAL